MTDGELMVKLIEWYIAYWASLVLAVVSAGVASILVVMDEPESAGFGFSFAIVALVFLGIAVLVFVYSQYRRRSYEPGDSR